VLLTQRALKDKALFSLLHTYISSQLNRPVVLCVLTIIPRLVPDCRQLCFVSILPSLYTSQTICTADSSTYSLVGTVRRITSRLLVSGTRRHSQENLSSLDCCRLDVKGLRECKTTGILIKFPPFATRYLSSQSKLNLELSLIRS
jgi:hypothetical protein